MPWCIGGHPLHSIIQINMNKTKTSDISVIALTKKKLTNEKENLRKVTKPNKIPKY